MTNGWTNPETWLANVWLSEIDFARTAEEMTGEDLATFADAIQTAINDMIEEHAGGMPASLASDLLAAAKGAININELARHYHRETHNI